MDVILEKLKEIKIENRKSLLSMFNTNDDATSENDDEVNRVATTEAENDDEANTVVTTEITTNEMTEEEAVVIDMPDEEDTQSVEVTRMEPLDTINYNSATADENINKNIYQGTFLPAQPTAPVFLPPSIQQQSSTPSMISDSYSFIAAPPATAAAAACSVQQPESNPSIVANKLPPPLLPETTASARNAAVLMQFNETGRHSESDDEDFHSTSDSEEMQRNSGPTSNIQNQQEG